MTGISLTPPLQHLFPTETPDAARISLPSTLVAQTIRISEFQASLDDVRNTPTPVSPLTVIGSSPHKTAPNNFPAHEFSEGSFMLVLEAVYFEK